MFLTALNGARSLAPKVPLNRIKKGHSTLPSHEDLFVFVVYQGRILQVMDFISTYRYFLKPIYFVGATQGHRWIELHPVRLILFVEYIHEKVPLDLYARSIFSKTLFPLPLLIIPQVKHWHVVRVSLHHFHLVNLVIVSHGPQVKQRLLEENFCHRAAHCRIVKEPIRQLVAYYFNLFKK